MSNNHPQENHETGYGRLLRVAKEEAFAARRKLRREQPSPSLQTKQEVATALADYHDLLLDYHDERALDRPWDERMPLDLDDRLDTTVEVEKPIQSRNRNAKERVEVPSIIEFSPNQLISLGKELDAIAKELGFAASAKQPTPHEEASMSDLRGLLRARGQTAALENLPEGDDEEDEDEASEQPAIPDGGEEE